MSDGYFPFKNYEKQEEELIQKKLKGFKKIDEIG